MAKRNPECIFTDNNDVIAWEDATDQQKQEYFNQSGGAESNEGKRGPDTGHGKGSRKKRNNSRY